MTALRTTYIKSWARSFSAHFSRVSQSECMYVSQQSALSTTTIVGNCMRRFLSMQPRTVHISRKYFPKSPITSKPTASVNFCARRTITNRHSVDEKNPPSSSVVQLRLSEKPRQKGDVINKYCFYGDNSLINLKGCQGSMACGWVNKSLHSTMSICHL